MTKYKYVGDGAGVPGLPHEISEDEAKEAGIEHLLKVAIDAGVYVDVKTVAPATRVSGVADGATKAPRLKEK